jgi:CHRD domain/PEP-CTERM motif
MWCTLSKFVRASCLVVLASGMSASAATIQYSAILGPEALGATGTGFALITIDTDVSSMRVEANFAGLSGLSSVAHIHCCTSVPGTGLAGVATTTPSFTGWPAGVTAGSYDFTYDMTLASSFSATFVTNNGGTPGAALATLIAGIDAGRAYFNVHSSTFPGGEIRGFLTAVPEPGTALLLGLGLSVLARRGRGQG